MNRDAVEAVDMVGEIAGCLLSSPLTVELTAWDDGDFQVTAFHTIDGGVPDGAAFHRELLLYSSLESGDCLAWMVHRKEGGETGGLWEDPVAGDVDDLSLPSLEDYHAEVVGETTPTTTTETTEDTDDEVRV